MVYQSGETDGMNRKLARLHSGKTNRKNTSEFKREREKSPVIFTNKNLKQAMSRSRIEKDYK